MKTTMVSQQQAQQINAMGIVVSQQQAQATGGSQQQSFSAGNNDPQLSPELLDKLTELSEKLDDIKDDTEVIKDYTSHIEEIFDRVDDLEEFLIKNLGSDFTVIKHAWKEYKEGKINKKQLIAQGIKLLGKRFLKKIVGSVI